MEIGQLEIPQEINVVAVPINWLSRERVSLDGKQLLVLKNKVINLYGVDVKLIPKGAFKIKPHDVRTVKYLTINDRGEEMKLEGFAVLERTGEKLNDVPVFKVSQREPEVFLKGYVYEVSDCNNVKVLETSNIISYTYGCEKVKDTLEFGLAFIVPIDKTARFEVILEGTRRRYLIFWNNGNPAELENVYDLPKDDEIL